MIDLQENVDLKKFNTYGFTSISKYLVIASSVDQTREAVVYALENKLPFRVIGLGSNIIVNPKGYDGITIINKAKFMEVDDSQMKVSSGSTLWELCDKMQELGLTGAEKLAGIPGSVGGAIYGNAGAFGFQIGDVVREIEYIDQEGKRKKIDGNNVHFSYRNSDFKRGEIQGVIISISLNLKKDLPERVKEKIDQTLEARMGKHPQGASCGSFFKNIEADSLDEVVFEKVKQWENHGKIPVGKLIDEVGEKKMSVGGIHVSEKHANFLLSDGSGTPEEVIELAGQIKDKVKDRFGIELEEEVRYL